MPGSKGQMHPMGKAVSFISCKDAAKLASDALAFSAQRGPNVLVWRDFSDISDQLEEQHKGYAWLIDERYQKNCRQF